MDQPSPALIPPSSAALPDTQLHGAPLMVARTVWMTLFALNLIWFGLATAPQVATTLHPRVAATCTLTPTTVSLWLQPLKRPLGSESIAGGKESEGR